MSKEKLEKLEREKYVVERKLTAAMHKEKRLQSELKRLTRSGRTHRLCTRAGMLETFLKEPTTLTDDDVMELLTFIFHSEAISSLPNARPSMTRTPKPSSATWIVFCSSVAVRPAPSKRFPRTGWARRPSPCRPRDAHGASQKATVRTPSGWGGS